MWLRYTTKHPFLSARLTTARVPERNSRKSCSIPSLKITPFSGICETRTRGCCAVTRPKTIVAWVVLLGNGSRTVKHKYSASHGNSLRAENAGCGRPRPESCGGRPNISAWVSRANCDPAFWTIPAAPVNKLLSQPVEPTPVEIITPLDDWFS